LAIWIIGVLLYYVHSLGVTEETTKETALDGIANISHEILIGHLPNKRSEHYRYTSLFRVKLHMVVFCKVEKSGKEAFLDYLDGIVPAIVWKDETFGLNSR
jgi:hypothetical protein